MPLITHADVVINGIKNQLQLGFFMLFKGLSKLVVFFQELRNLLFAAWRRLAQNIELSS